MSIAPAAHTRRSTTTDDWITPRWLIERLGTFDLDPCASKTQPWPCASRSFNVDDNGLLKPWSGSVWMNPPYGRRASEWMARLANHGDGVALVFARTDTRMFFDHVWPKAAALLFIRGRLTFNRPDGSTPPKGHNSGGPSVLIAYGSAAERLQAVQDLGCVVRLARQ